MSNDEIVLFEMIQKLGFRLDDITERVERLERFRSCYDPTFRPFNTSEEKK